MEFNVGDKVTYVCNNPYEPHNRLKRGYVGDVRETSIGIRGWMVAKVYWQSGLSWWVPFCEIRLSRPEELET